MLFLVCYLVINGFFPKKTYSGKVLKKELGRRLSRSLQRFTYKLILDNKKTVLVPPKVYAVIEVGDEVTVQTQFMNKMIETLYTEFKQSRDIHQLQLKLDNEKGELAWRRRIITFILLAVIIVLIFNLTIFS